METPSADQQVLKKLDSWSFLLSTTQDGIVAKPQSSQEQGMTWNNSYVRLIPLVQTHVIFPFARDEQKASVGELLTAIKYLI